MPLNEYEVGKLCGKGKFSTVYKAKRKVDNLTVAVKKIAVDVMDRKEVETCMQEVMLLKSVTDHPNIISYFDCIGVRSGLRVNVSALFSAKTSH